MTDAVSIVIVDDSPEVRSVTRTALRLARRFDVVGEGGDGAAAVALAEELRPELLLLDVSMPVMDGLEALPRVIEASPQTRVVMYTGFEEGGLADRARALGARGFVEKSASPRELIEVLLGLLPDGDDVADLAPSPPTPGVVHDVLAEHLERFREVFEEAAIGMATMTLSGHLVRANRALAELLDRPVESLVGLPYSDLVVDDPATAGALADLQSGARAVAQLEHEITGAGRLALVTIAAVRDSVGRPLYLFLQMQDVTAQREAERELRRSEERFRLLVEAVQDYAIFMLTPEGRVASWNAGAQRIKGYSASDIIGRHFRTFYPPEKQEEQHPEHELTWALRDGHYEEEGWRVRKDGSLFWANVLITAVYDDDGRHVGFAKVTRDMTERRRMLDHLEQANRRLEGAAREQAQFLAVTAHELRTPVSVLGASSDMLARHWDELTGDERQALLTSMSASTVRLGRLIDDLLTASRLGRGIVELLPETVPVAQAVAASVGAVSQVSDDARFEVDVASDLLVRADPERLAQVLDNLLANAVLHGTPPVSVSAAGRGDFVEIRVTDAGAGVPGDVQPRLFDRFVTGKPGSGTGLGLFIVRELARAHGGDAVYEPGNGTGPGGVFVLRLPAAPPGETR